MSRNTRQPSLSTPVFHILLALVDRDRHGYAIIKEIEQRSGGEVVLSTGTLYAAIKRLVESGLIEQTDRPSSPSDDERRRYYRLTTAGRLAARQEVERMAALVGVAQRKRLIRGVTLPAGLQGSAT